LNRLGDIVVNLFSERSNTRKFAKKPFVRRGKESEQGGKGRRENGEEEKEGRGRRSTQHPEVLGNFREFVAVDTDDANRCREYASILQHVQHILIDLCDLITRL